MVKTAAGMTTWLNLMAIAAGGAVGAVCRYLITLAAASIPGGSSSAGTTVTNVLGCALIGGFVQAILLADQTVSPRFILAIQVGFLGSLTTFSTFALDANGLASAGRWNSLTFYLLANVALGWIVLVAAAAVVKGWVS